MIAAIRSLANRKINPLTLRCMRQELRSKVFISLYLLALVACGVTTLLIANESNRSYSPYGLAAYASIYWAWGFLIIPVSAGRCYNILRNERKDDTWDLLELSGMHPSRIIFGIFYHVMAQMFFYSSAILPFLVISYFLGGIDLMSILLGILLMFASTASYNSLALYLACHTTKKGISVLLPFLIWSGGFIVLWAIGAWVSFDRFGLAGYTAELMAGEEWAWVSFGLISNIILVGVPTLLIHAAALLLHPSQDRSSSIRLSILFLLSNFYAWLFFMPVVAHGPKWHEVSLAASIVTGALGAFLLGILGTEHDKLSPRQLASISEYTGIKKRLRNLLGPGRRRGIRFCFTLLIFSVISAIIHAANANSRDEYLSFIGPFYFGSSAILLFITDILSPKMSSYFPKEWADKFSRIFFFILVAVSLVFSLIAMVAIGGIQNDDFLYALNPFTFAPFLAHQISYNNYFPAILAAIIMTISSIYLLIKYANLNSGTRTVVANEHDRNPREP